MFYKFTDLVISRKRQDRCSNYHQFHSNHRSIMRNQTDKTKENVSWIPIDSYHITALLWPEKVNTLLSHLIHSNPFQKTRSLSEQPLPPSFGTLVLGLLVKTVIEIDIIFSQNRIVVNSHCNRRNIMWNYYWHSKNLTVHHKYFIFTKYFYEIWIIRILECQ